jgi:hypothetical protein
MEAAILSITAGMRSVLFSFAAYSKLECRKGNGVSPEGQPLKPATRLITPANTDRACLFPAGD